MRVFVLLKSAKLVNFWQRSCIPPHLDSRWDFLKPDIHAITKQRRRGEVLGAILFAWSLRLYLSLHWTEPTETKHSVTARKLDAPTRESQTWSWLTGIQPIDHRTIDHRRRNWSSVVSQPVYRLPHWVHHTPLLHHLCFSSKQMLRRMVHPSITTSQMYKQRVNCGEDLSDL